MSQELQNKLYHFTATPPEHSWDTLAEALDHHSRPYVQRMSNYAETPATHNWEAITNGLSASEKPARVISSPGFRFPVKMMIAVALLAVLAFGIIRIIDSGPLTGERTPETAKQLPPGIKSEGLEDTKQKGTEASENKDHNLTRTYSQEAATETVKAAKEVKWRPNRYVTISNDEGKQVRLSKKAYTLMACAENSTAANYNSCKENIELMRQKMSASLISPSGDFSGLVDMVRSLEEIN